MLEHIRTAHPEWAPLANPPNERAFFELLALDGAAYTREDLWSMDQGIMPYPTITRKVGDIHPTHLYGTPCGPKGSPGIAGPPALVKRAAPAALATSEDKAKAKPMVAKSTRPSLAVRLAAAAAPPAATSMGKSAARPILIEDDASSSDDGDDQEMTDV